MVKRVFLYIMLVGTILAATLSTTGEEVNASSGNLISNSGFEAGMTGWKSISQNVDDMCLLDSSLYYSGTRSLKMHREAVNPHETIFAVVGMYTALPVNTDFTLSFYARTDSGTKLLMSRLRSYPVGGGWNQQNAIDATLTVGTVWTKYSISGRTLASAEKNMYRVQFDLDSEGDVWIDNVQLESGNTATSYVAKDTLEMGLNIGRLETGVFKQGEEVMQSVCVYNSGSTAKNISVNYEVSDMWDTVIDNETIYFTVNSGSRYEGLVNLTPDSKGYYRIRWYLKEGNTVLVSTYSSFVYTFDHMSDTVLN